MKPIEKISAKGVLLNVLFVFLTSSVWAQESVTKQIGDVAKDNMASFYIIGGVIVFGIFAYVIYNKALRKDDDSQPHPFIKHSHPRHHRRVIRKSA